MWSVKSGYHRFIRLKLVVRVSSWFGVWIAFRRFHLVHAFYELADGDIAYVVACVLQQIV